MNTDILTVYSSHFTKCLAWIRQLHSTMLCCYAKPNLRISTTILSPTYTNCCTFLLFSLPTLNRISSFPISVSKKPCLQIFHHWLTNGVPPRGGEDRPEFDLDQRSGHCQWSYLCIAKDQLKRQDLDQDQDLRSRSYHVQALTWSGNFWSLPLALIPRIEHTYSRNRIVSGLLQSFAIFIIWYDNGRVRQEIYFFEKESNSSPNLWH